MSTSSNIYWIQGPWPGKLGMAARPRGGDWLEDEVMHWRREGIGSVLSVLTPEEEQDLGLHEEGKRVRMHGIKFTSFPIPDRDVPNSESELRAVLEGLDADLAGGRNVLVHCRQGVGRIGLIAASLLISKGISSEQAMDEVSLARGLRVPETKEQRRWIDHFAAVHAGTR